MSGERPPKEQKPADREKLADKVLEIFSDSPEDMKNLFDLLKKMEKSPALHPDKKRRDGLSETAGGEKQT